MLTRAWDQVLTTTIVNCFKKAKISAASQIEAINDSDNPFNDLKYQLDKLRRRDSFSLLQSNSVESFVDFDNDVQSSNGVMTEEKVLREVIGDDDDLNEDKEEDLELVDKFYQSPTGSVVISGLNTLSIFGIFNDASVKDNVMTLTSKQ